MAFILRDWKYWGNDCGRRVGEIETGSYEWDTNVLWAYEGLRSLQHYQIAGKIIINGVYFPSMGHLPLRSAPWDVQTYIQCALAGLAGYLLCKWLDCGLWVSTVTALILAYIPSFCDGKEYTAEGRLWTWFMRQPAQKRLASYFPLSFKVSHLVCSLMASLRNLWMRTGNMYSRLLLMVHWIITFCNSRHHILSSR